MSFFGGVWVSLVDGEREREGVVEPWAKKESFIFLSSAMLV